MQAHLLRGQVEEGNQVGFNSVQETRSIRSFDSYASAMSDVFDDFLRDAELAVFERRALSLSAAAEAGLPGRFESFSLGGLRVSSASEPRYEFLNIIEGVTEESVGSLPAVFSRIPTLRQATIIATSPSRSLIDTLLSGGYEPAPARPIAFLRSSFDRAASTSLTEWEIREVLASQDSTLFAELLKAGYAASDDVWALIRAEHVLPQVRGFIASRDDLPMAVAAMTFHGTASVLGGASTLPAARGTGAQSALLIHRHRLATLAGSRLSAATAAPASPSLRNLARLGFTIVERSAWRFNPRNATNRTPGHFRFNEPS